MELKTIEYNLSVCKVTDISDIDLSSDFFFIGKTDEELWDQSARVKYHHSSSFPVRMRKNQKRRTDRSRRIPMAIHPPTGNFKCAEEVRSSPEVSAGCSSIVFFLTAVRSVSVDAPVPVSEENVLPMEAALLPVPALLPIVEAIVEAEKLLFSAIVLAVWISFVMSFRPSLIRSNRISLKTLRR